MTASITATTRPTQREMYTCKISQKRGHKDKNSLLLSSLVADNERITPLGELIFAVVVCALSLLQCFVFVGWMTGITWRFCSDTGEGRKST